MVGKMLVKVVGILVKEVVKVVGVVITEVVVGVVGVWL